LQRDWKLADVTSVRADVVQRRYRLFEWLLRLRRSDDAPELPADAGTPARTQNQPPRPADPGARTRVVQPSPHRDGRRQVGPPRTAGPPSLAHTAIVPRRHAERPAGDGDGAEPRRPSATPRVLRPPPARVTGDSPLADAALRGADAPRRSQRNHSRPGLRQ